MRGTVHFCLRELDVLIDFLCDGVAWFNNPETLVLRGFASLEITG